MRWIGLFLIAVLSGCGDDNRNVGGVTHAEAAALDRAAARIDSDRAPAPIPVQSTGAERSPQ